MIMVEKKILLVEDDPDHAELIIEILEEESNKEVVLKRDGQEAIDYFQNHSLDTGNGMQSEISIAILDLNLPKVSGLDVLKFIKDEPKYYLIPAVMFTTSSDHRTVAEAYKSGANGYITKPISYDEFVNKIRLLKDYWLKTNELPTGAEGSKGRILIADDDDVFLESTADLLRREGYECDCAFDATAAIEKMKSSRYDLLIADINMPGNTELELIKELSVIEKRLPVILATGKPAFHSEFQLIEHPIIAYMLKPLDFNKLLAQVKISIEKFQGRK